MGRGGSDKSYLRKEKKQRSHELLYEVEELFYASMNHFIKFKSSDAFMNYFMRLISQVMHL